MASTSDVLLSWSLVALSLFGFFTVKLQVRVLLSIGDGLRRAYPVTDPFLYKLQKTLRVPLQRFAYILYLYLAVIAAPWSEALRGLESFLAGVLLLLLIVSSIFIIEAVAVLRKVAEYWIHRNVADRMMVLYLVDAATVLLVVFRGIVYLALLSSALAITVDQRLFSLVAELILSLNLFSLLIALGLIIPLRNAVSSVLILFDRPFEIGDQVEIQSVAGVVQKVSLFFVDISQGEGFALVMSHICWLHVLLNPCIELLIFIEMVLFV